MYRKITNGIEVRMYLVYVKDNYGNISYRVYDNYELIWMKSSTKGLVIKVMVDAKILRLQLLFRYAIGLALILNSVNFSVNRRGRYNSSEQPPG